LIHALKQCIPEEKDKTKELLLLARKEGGKNAAQEILSLIQKYKGIDYSLQCAQKLIADAQSQLNIFADCPQKDQFNAVAEYILSRNI
jgi:geranylgeranyl pyrophosphate synthase